MKVAGPKAYRGIMVSSTFSDLKEHRSEVIQAIEMLGYRANVMETSGAQVDNDVIDTSLRMVQDSAAFVGVISHRYGQTPNCPVRNPDGLSISELEFNEAMRLERPILLFIMGKKHPLTVDDVEDDPQKKLKLDAFRERAKQMRSGSDVERIYQVFDSRDEFTKAASIAAGKLSQGLPPHSDNQDARPEPEADRDRIETALPPELRAVPRYLGSHGFVGRAAELSILDDWCADADQHPMLLFEAIGGSGKSMVTWTWLKDHAMQARSDWAGRFWFSFYEGGATMTSFCREALAYMTGLPVEALRKEKARALMPRLIAELEARPWLIVLDGLERVLVAYHRIDAPQLRDEDIETAEDQIANRDPRAAINPEDEELLRLLTAAAPSKLLITSRLTPQALINRSDMPLPGVRREMLRGLRPSDAEILFRTCGISGDSKSIQEYLQRNCDCHPLVIGALAGLVNNYLPDRGNFTAWLADPDAGGKLDLSDLDLTQRRNHILDAAIEALPEAGRRLLQTLSLLQSGADYATLKEFNPHMPLPPTGPVDPESDLVDWFHMDSQTRKDAKAKYERARTKYPEALRTWEQSSEVRAAPARFNETLKELERRGLLQYEHSLKRYDLHPVVRGVAAGRMDKAETDAIGARVVDYFSSRPHDPFVQAESLEDLAPGIQIVATLTRIGDFDRALNALRGELSSALFFNLSAYREMQRLLRPFFPKGWEGPIAASELHHIYILGLAHFSLHLSDPAVAVSLCTREIKLALSDRSFVTTRIILGNLSYILHGERKFADAMRLEALALDLAEAIGREQDIFVALLRQYTSAYLRGAFDYADALWTRIDPMGRDWSRDAYRGGEAERVRAMDLFSRHALTEVELDNAHRLCEESRNRRGICRCLSLRGRWHISRNEPALAVDPLTEALRLDRDSGEEAFETEALLALAQKLAKHPIDTQAVAERLNDVDNHETALVVAEIWRELGESKKAVAAALRAHKSACGSGEPYVYRYYLDRAEALLRELGEAPPKVPEYDPANDEIFDWEDEVRTLIGKAGEDRQEREQNAAEKEKRTPPK